MKNIPDKRTVPIGCDHVEVDVRGATDGHCVQVAVPAPISVNIFILWFVQKLRSKVAQNVYAKLLAKVFAMKR